MDALDKSTGRASFGADVKIPNKVCAYILRSPVMGGRAKRISAEKALKERGVLDVVEFERGVAVLAEKYWQAKRASQQVEVDWGKGLIEGLSTASLATEAKRFSHGPGSHRIKNVGDVDECLKIKTTHTLNCNMHIPYLSHATMEPQNCCSYDR